MKLSMQRGEVRRVRFPGPDTRRPVVILTRDSALRYLTSVTVAPVTSTVRDIPSQVLLTPEDDGVPSVCAASLDNVQTVRKCALFRPGHGPLPASRRVDRPYLSPP